MLRNFATFRYGQGKAAVDVHGYVLVMTSVYQGVIPHICVDFDVARSAISGMRRPLSTEWAAD